MSKRIGGFAIKDLREEGFESQAVMSLLSQLGTGASKVCKTFAEVIKNFNLKNLGKASANYEIKELEKINEKLLHTLSYDEIKNRLNEIGMEKVDEQFWNSVKQNLKKLYEIKDWWQICKEGIKNQNAEENMQFLKEALATLPNEKLDENSWDKWIASIKDVTGRKGKELFKPLRLALTGQEHGPELKKLLPLINREEITKRLTN
jgi:glutamyl-tRNA synthetase